MPRYPITVKQHKRKARKSRRRNNPNRATYKIARDPFTSRPLQGVINGLPQVRRTVLRYCSGFQLTSTVGSLASFVLRANGCHDPDYSSGGSNHQPLGWDQYKLLYNHYVVHNCKITVIFQPSTTSLPLMSAIGVYLDDDFTNTSYTDYTGYIEARKGTVKIMNLRTNVRNDSKVQGYFNAKQFFNVKDVKDNLSRLGAIVTTDPSEHACFRVWFQSLDASTVTVGAVAVLEYDVEFSEPADLSQS